ncbi:MAG: hypothetical protein JW751_27875 [Polyangiaceae bacterium]|nr:hypothetical protein [Polyangiaceae bacterium]
MIAHTMLMLPRSATRRSDGWRDVPWRTLLREVLLALVTLSSEQLGPRALFALTPG